MSYYAGYTAAGYSGRMPMAELADAIGAFNAARIYFIFVFVFVNLYYNVDDDYIFILYFQINHTVRLMSNTI
jgi:hypothetical protein